MAQDTRFMDSRIASAETRLFRLVENGALESVSGRRELALQRKVIAERKEIRRNILEA